MKTALPRECVLRALEVATAAHRGQTRADGTTEFVDHPWRVAVLIRAFGGSVEEEVAALLHDCEEDCPGFDLDAALAYIFAGLLPARAVAGVREVIRALRHRDSEPNHVYFQRIIDAPPSTLKIKLYDRFDNVLGLADFTEERCRRYCAKTALLVRMMRDRAIILGMADLVAAIEEGASEALERLNAPARTGCTA